MIQIYSNICHTWIYAVRCHFISNSTFTDGKHSSIIFPRPFSHLIESSSLFHFQTHAWIINKSLHTCHRRAHHNPHKHIFHWIPNVTFCICLYCRFGGNVTGADGLGPPLSHYTHPPSGTVFVWIADYMCLSLTMYLSKLQNVFV